MNDRRIIYILEPFDFPSGGVSAIYRHVEILSGNGLPAYVALREKPKTDFYQTTAPLLIHGGRLQARAGDIFVIPEGFTSYVKALTSSPA